MCICTPFTDNKTYRMAITVACLKLNPMDYCNCLWILLSDRVPAQQCDPYTEESLE